ncbi:MAG: helix-turn-helix domain-containing protein [Saprospiraceae bacterium]
MLNLNISEFSLMPAMPALILLLAGMLTLCLALFFRLRRSNRLLAEYRQRYEEQAGALRQVDRFKLQLNELLSGEKAASMPDDELLGQIRKLRRFYHKHRRPAPAGIDDRAVDGHAAGGEWLERLQRCVRENLADSQFNVESLARLMGASRKSLYREIREYSGMSANQYIQDVRLLVAREKIESGEVENLSALARSVGFRTANYLSRLYRERFGESPVP